MDAALPDVALPTAGLSRSGADGSVVAGVDAELDTLAQLPLAQHADVFERLHRGLRDSLADIDDA